MFTDFVCPSCEKALHDAGQTSYDLEPRNGYVARVRISTTAPATVVRCEKGHQSVLVIHDGGFSLLYATEGRVSCSVMLQRTIVSGCRPSARARGYVFLGAELGARTEDRSCCLDGNRPRHAATLHGRVQPRRRVQVLPRLPRGPPHGKAALSADVDAGPALEVSSVPFT
jgi:hypothetical protein